MKILFNPPPPLNPYGIPLPQPEAAHDPSNGFFRLPTPGSTGNVTENPRATAHNSFANNKVRSSTAFILPATTYDPLAASDSFATTLPTRKDLKRCSPSSAARESPMSPASSLPPHMHSVKQQLDDMRDNLGQAGRSERTLSRARDGIRDGTGAEARGRNHRSLQPRADSPSSQNSDMYVDFMYELTGGRAPAKKGRYDFA